MSLELASTAEDRDFQRRLCEFLDRELTEEIRRQHPLDLGLGAEGRRFMRRLGAAGFLGAGWPAAYGGSGGGVSREILLSQEFARREAYVPNSVARLMAGPVILRHGSEAMKREFLPRIAQGEIEFSLGYTEPSAGSDLAALRMRAVRDGDHFVIFGQKLFNTQSHYADYHWLAVRTDRISRPRSIPWSSCRSRISTCVSPGCPVSAARSTTRSRSIGFRSRTRYRSGPHRLRSGDCSRCCSRRRLPSVRKWWAPGSVC